MIVYSLFILGLAIFNMEDDLQGTDDPNTIGKGGLKESKQPSLLV
jgi:hypothetical protein